MLNFALLLGLQGPLAWACPPYEVRVQVMDELAQKHPQAAVLYLRRSQANLSLNRAQEALQDLAQVRRLDPTISQVAFQEGQAYLQLEQPAQAERAFARYLEAPPADLTRLPQVQTLLARGPMDLDRFIRKSREQIGELVWKYQDGELTEMLCDETASAETARAQRARSLKALGRQDEAAQELQRLAQDHPGPDYVLERARLLKEHPSENRPERLERQAFCLRSLGRSTDARVAYLAALSALEARPLRARESPAGKALAQRIQGAMHWEK